MAAAYLAPTRPARTRFGRLPLQGGAWPPAAHPPCLDLDVAVLKIVPRKRWALWKATPDELALRLSLWVWHVKERDGQSPDPGLDARIKKLQAKCERHRDRFPT